MSARQGDVRRVALVIGQLDWGGAERQLFLEAKGLASRGIAVEVGCLSNRVEPYGPKLQSEGIPVHAFARRSAFDMARVLGMRRWLTRSAPDAIGSFGEFAAVYVDIALALTGSRPPHLAMLQRSAPSVDGVRRLLVRRAVRRAEGVSANSEAGRAYGASAFGLDAASIRIQPNLLPREIFETVADPAGVRSELGLAADEPLVCYVGRIAKAKDIPTLCRTLAAIERIVPRHTALVVGHALDRHPDGHPDAGTRVRWLGVRSDVPRLMAASDVVLLTSNTEGTPNVVLEALAVGTPVVSTRVGDVAAIVEEPGAGAIAAPGDHEALANSVAEILADRAAARRMGARGRAHVEEAFGPQRAGADLLESLRTAARARR